MTPLSSTVDAVPRGGAAGSGLSTVEGWKAPDAVVFVSVKGRTLAAVSMLSAREVHKAYGNRSVLSGASLALAAGQRAGLVGRNGAGKSTLARILARVELPDAGEVVWSKDLRVCYLEQEPRLAADDTVLDAVLAGKRDWLAAQARHAEASAALARGESAQQWLPVQTEAAAEIEKHGGWDVAHEAEAMLAQLRIVDGARPVGQLSGGQRRRVALARAFISDPDVLILDEPTNHLDIPTIEWLEEHLRSEYRGAALLVTHDRYLLDRVVDTTFELSRAGLFRVDGGWEAYLIAKAERLAHEARVEANRQNYLRRELEWLRRQPKARTTKSKSRVGRVEAALAQSTVEVDRVAKLGVSGTRSGKTVLELDELAIGRDHTPLASGLTLRLSPGQRVGVVGPNGCGKSTLLATLRGELEPVAGRITLGKNTRVAYLDQARAGLDDTTSVFDVVADGRSVVTFAGETLTMRAYLERFSFDTAAQQQRVGTLSGGERARVALAKILRDETNLLILDEPTNDLDVDTLGALEHALLAFGGVVVTVTHDRWFLDRIATHILAFEPDHSFDVVVGNYGDYLAKRVESRAAKTKASERREGTGVQTESTRSVTVENEPRPRKLTYAERLELDKLEPKIEAAEAKLAELQAQLEDPDFYRKPHEQQRTFHDDVAQAEALVGELMTRWEDLEARRGLA
ncbi:MAG: ABC-F family ATP-binding cassette domain-containing protein [Myxococcales bacterium FL481]|nr:MAG: ABC-F family ATP-binding cassette domain-containing protein [Myxococcales bacterium FL481]